ncbi:MAG: gamma-glutamylcyclotransferase family protein [Gammaproteobacteria bacterium]
MKHFAYGSNMSQKQMQCRCKASSPQKLDGIFSLAKHALAFHKQSKKDDSGKCNACYTGEDGDNVLGVVYEIGEADMHSLDEYEGHPTQYRRKPVCVISESGNKICAEVYFACKDTIKEGLCPTAGYKSTVLSGAEEAGFPAEYIAKIKAVKTD